MNHKSIAVLAVAMAAIVAVMSFSMPAEAAEEDQDYDQDLGVMYGYVVQFVFTGSDASSVTWDFGDGTEPVTAWNPQHTYSEKGVYYVTQDAYNTYQGGSHSIAVYKITIAGYPWIEFVSNGGSEIATIQMESGGNSAVAAEKPVDPVREGYTFTGWFTDASLQTPYDWSSPVREAVTLYAGWEYNGSEPTFTVKFNSNEGTEIASQTVASGDLIVKPADPVRDGYTFGGWYLGDQPYDFSTPVTANITLTAHWDAVDSADDETDGFPLWIIGLIATAILAIAAVYDRNWILAVVTLAAGVVTVLLYIGVF